MSRIAPPFNGEELASMSFRLDGSDDWAFLFMRAMATIETLNIRLTAATDLAEQYKADAAEVLTIVKDTAEGRDNSEVAAQRAEADAAEGRRLVLAWGRGSLFSVRRTDALVAWARKS